jgi:hypothetical protein
MSAHSLKRGNVGLRRVWMLTGRTGLGALLVLYWGNTLAVVLNPTRSVANMVGGKRPWRGPGWSESGRSR